ncbi:MAG: hypothetical protein KDD47_23675 [Acidobacteria bacterium]|nr:hypothetical protein [Acidobacteriota bacterium]
MRKSLSTFGLLVPMTFFPLAACQQGDGGAPPPPVEIVAPADLPIQEVLDRHLEALGGREALSALHSVRKVGKIGTSDFIGKPITTEIRAGERYLRRVEGDDGEIVMAYDGTTGWQEGAVPGTTEATPLGEAETAKLIASTDFGGPLVAAEAGGSRAALEGLTDFGYKVSLPTAAGLQRDFYLDKETFLVNRVEEVRNFSGNELLTVTTYDRYKPVAGVMIPFTEVTRIEEIDFDQAVRWEEIEANPELDDSLFAFPGGH